MTAKAVLEGRLHPLRVWKRSVVETLGVRGLQKFPSLANYVVANIFATICLEDQEVEDREVESRDDDVEITREQEEDSRVRATPSGGVSNSDDELGEFKPQEPIFYRARRMSRELREGSKQIPPPSPSEASTGGGPPENYLYPPLVPEREAKDLSQYDTFQKRMDFLKRPYPGSNNPSDWLFEVRTLKAMVRVVAMEIEQRDKTTKDIGVLEK
ncbi:unnamed protein product [Calypogeia fissa]